MGDAPKSSDRKTDRQEKLAAALRANLKRRKAAKRESRQAAAPDEARAADRTAGEDG